MDTEQTHIMVVEDDPSLAEWIMDYLGSHGFLVTTANRGDEAVTLIKEDNPDLVVLDIMLPEKDGFTVCREVRHFFHNPILMLTARHEEVDEVMGLETGADDYLGKPVKPAVLLARIKVLLRRNTNLSSATQREFGCFFIDSESRTVTLDAESVPLSSHEFELLWLLTANAGNIMSRDELVAQMRGIDYDGFDRSIDISISRLRKKLKDNPGQPKRIKTVRGKGYLLATDAW